ncbi:hypothetical protein KBD71_03495 [Candidatus Woesebacteria bacterium]|nr:hypothetical protein [Candidatus Woesebacteria bacterium]
MQQQFSLRTTLICSLVIGAVGFGGGVVYQRSQSPRFQPGLNGNRMQQTGSNQFRQNGMGMRPIAGEILSSDETGVTLKLADGSTKNILISDSVAVTSSTPASKNDLEVGTQVTVFGAQNSDGTIKAQSVSVGLLPLSIAPTATGAAQR